MKKNVALALLLILGLVIPNVALGYQGVQKPAVQIPHDFVLQNPVVPDPDPDPQAPTNQELPCGGQADIVIDATNPFASTTLQNIITDYRNHPDLGVSTLNTLRDRYELCFDIQNGHVTMEQSLNIANIGGETKGLAIYGLKVQPHQDLSPGDPLATVDYTTAPVELIDLSMANVLNGLSVIGTQISISNAIISGAGQLNSYCLEFVGANNSRLTGSIISGCGIGINSIASNDVHMGAADAATFAQDKNEITSHLDKGINIESGERITFGFNLIYNNNIVNHSHEDAVYLSDGVNNNVASPVVTPVERDGEEYMLDCDFEDDGVGGRIVTRREAQFVQQSGTITLYVADELTSQASEYLATCELIDGMCDLLNLSTSVPVPQGQCGVPPDEMYYVSAIYTATDGSSEWSSVLMAKELFIGIPDGVIFAESEGADIPTAPVDEGLGSSEDVLEVSGSGAEGGGSGGCMKASLLPNDVGSTYAPHLGAWWIIFSIAFLASMRFAKARVRRRKK